MFGSYLGSREITQLLVSHPVAKMRVPSPRNREVLGKWGWWFIKLFGYPLAPASRWIARAILRYLKPEPGEKILDAGCGMGYHAFELASKFGCEVYGIDIDKDKIRLANQIRELKTVRTVHYELGDVNDLIFRSDTFDKVLCAEVLEHVRDDKRVLNELYRVLKPGGFLVLVVPRTSHMEEYDRPDPKLLHPRFVNPFGIANTTFHNKPWVGHVRNGYTAKTLVKRLCQVEFDIIRYTTFIKKYSVIGNKMGMVWFPFSFLLSMFDRFMNEEGTHIIIKARKRPDYNGARGHKIRGAKTL